MKPPCIRSLKAFKKSGCPEAQWNEANQKGCTCWVSMPIADPANPLKSTLFWGCVDVIAHHQRHQNLVALSGVHSAIETFRNGMLENVNGNSIPKMSRDGLLFLDMLKRNKQIL